MRSYGLQVVQLLTGSRACSKRNGTAVHGKIHADEIKTDACGQARHHEFTLPSTRHSQGRVQSEQQLSMERIHEQGLPEAAKYCCRVPGRAS